MKRPSLSLWLTILSFLIIFTDLIIRNYSLLQTQFLYNEHAWNFLQHALTGSLIFNLFHTDAGYVPLLPRLITLLLVRGLRVITYYPLISDLFGFAFIALCCSLVTLKPFKQYIRSDTIRFLLSIALGTATDKLSGVFFPLDIKDFNTLNYTLTVYDRACKRILRTSLVTFEDGKLTSIFEPIADSRNQEYCFSISNSHFNIKTIGVLTYHDPDLSGK